jgi:GntR family transcriptional regulator / MocR family aminotransferase
MGFDLPIALDRTAAAPLADQLAGQLRLVAAHGVLKMGEKLPSTRTLAAGLGVSRTVTAAAYEQLYAEGWIAGRHGSGTYVVAVPPGSPSRRPSRPTDLVDAAEPGADLRPGSPWAAGIRPAIWRRAWRAAADPAPDARPIRAGLSEYRTAVAEHAVRHRGLAPEPADVLATGGTTVAVAELGRALFEPGDIIAVEEPGYPRAMGALRAAGLVVVPARVDQDGIVVADLPDGVRAVYCTPAHQFPLGGTLPAGRRVDLIAWARERGAWIIEDDYDGELRYDVAPLPLLASLGPDVVIHLGTTSKILTPTLGCGWMIAPPEVVASVVHLRAETGAGPSLAGQRVYTALASSGDLARHLRRVRSELAARRGLVVATLSTAGQDVLGDRAGTHVVVPLPGAQAERTLIAAARDRGLLLDGLQRCFAGRPSRFGLTLGYAAPPHREVLSGALLTLVALRRAG